MGVSVTEKMVADGRGKLRLDVERVGDRWVVTSPSREGVLGSAEHLEQALARAADALERTDARAALGRSID